MESSNSPKPILKTPLHILFFATLVIGIVSGLAGMSLAMLLHFTQHLAYGYSSAHIISDESFLEGVTAASGQRRVLILSLCGLVTGLGWWLIYRYGKPLVSIAKAVNSEKPYMPIKTTILHDLLQIIAVGLGSPLGREVAPRELSATFACWFSSKMQLSTRESQVLVACAAGAGLAAVYNVPLGGAMFTLETLLCTLHWSAVLPALATATIATVVSWIGLGSESQYYSPNFSISYSLVIWSILAGPIFGFTAFWFRKITTSARNTAPRNWQLLILCPLNFALIGILAVYFPALLGNGKGSIQLGFTDILGVELAAALLILRIFIVWSSLRAGTEGGLLTPSLANGVLLAVVLGGLWSLAFPGTHPGAFAIVGAAAFLAASQKMPLTAIVLTAEFTSINFNFLIPILFAISGSMIMFNICTKEITFTSIQQKAPVH